MQKSHLFLAMLLVITILLLSGCGEHIEDLDESSHELNTLTTADFTAGSYSSTSSGVSISTSSSYQTIAEDTEDIDHDYVKRSGGKTSGVFSVIGARLNTGETMRFDINVEPESGNIGLAVIAPSEELLYQFNTPGSDSYSFTAEENGVYLVRAATESFSGEITAERTWE